MNCVIVPQRIIENQAAPSRPGICQAGSAQHAYRKRRRLSFTYFDDAPTSFYELSKLVGEVMGPSFVLKSLNPSNIGLHQRLIAFWDGCAAN